MQRRLSSVEVDRLVAKHASGLTVGKLARDFNIHRTTVLRYLDDRDVQRRPNVRKMTDEQVASAALRYAEGQSLSAVAADFDVHARTLAREFHLAGLPIRPRSGWPRQA